MPAPAGGHGARSGLGPRTERRRLVTPVRWCAVSVLVAEGGYQAFALGSAEWLWLTFSAVVAVVALVVGLVLMRRVLAADQGTERMQEVAGAIREGATAFLRRQYRTIVVIAVPVGLLVYLASTRVLTPVGEEALSQAQSGALRTAAFLAGALLSGLAGYVGMSLAVRANVRTAATARGGHMGPALDVAFRSGGVTGLFTVGAGLLGATVIIMVAQNTATAMLVGFGLGGSLIALFMRVGGGIFTKAADVGADLVGKLEEGIPEDDPRNPATIADNVGDNVGDCAGMAADLFESYEVTLVAALILGYGAFARWVGTRGRRDLPAGHPGLRGPRLHRRDLGGAGPRRRHHRPRPAHRPRLLSVGRGPHRHLHARRGHQFYAHQLRPVLGGGRWVWCWPIGCSPRQTQHFTTAADRRCATWSKSTPHRRGHHRAVGGSAWASRSSAWAMVTIGAAIVAALALGGGNIRLGSTSSPWWAWACWPTPAWWSARTGSGPIADNAAGIAEMSGGFDGEAERRDPGARCRRQHHQGHHQGLRDRLRRHRRGGAVRQLRRGGRRRPGPTRHRGGAVRQRRHADQRGRPKVFVGLLLGGTVVLPVLLADHSGRGSYRQHRGSGGASPVPRAAPASWPGPSARLRPGHRPCDQGLATGAGGPALLAVLAPVIVGFGFGYAALGGFLAATILTGRSWR